MCRKKWKIRKDNHLCTSGAEVSTPAYLHHPGVDLPARPPFCALLSLPVFFLPYAGSSNLCDHCRKITLTEKHKGSKDSAHYPSTKK